MQVKGKVLSGSGEGAKFIKLPWVNRQVTGKLGFTPYSGTLNVKITEDSDELNLLKKAKGIEILPDKGFCRGKCFKACFMDNSTCAVIIPEVENYPEDVIEVIAPVNLREKFKLKDEDVVKIEVIL